METASIVCCTSPFCNNEDVYLEKPRCDLDAGSPNLEPKEPTTENDYIFEEPTTGMYLMYTYQYKCI